MSLNLHLGGTAGFAVGMFAVAVAAGYTGQEALEVLSVFLGLISALCYLYMALDTYSRYSR